MRCALTAKEPASLARPVRWGRASAHGDAGGASGLRPGEMTEPPAFLPTCGGGHRSHANPRCRESPVRPTEQNRSLWNHADYATAVRSDWLTVALVLRWTPGSQQQQRPVETGCAGITRVGFCPDRPDLSNKSSRFSVPFLSGQTSRTWTYCRLLLAQRARLSRRKEACPHDQLVFDQAGHESRGEAARTDRSRQRVIAHAIERGASDVHVDQTAGCDRSRGGARPMSAARRPAECASGRRALPARADRAHAVGDPLDRVHDGVGRWRARLRAARRGATGCATPCGSTGRGRPGGRRRRSRPGRRPTEATATTDATREVTPCICGEPGQVRRP
jgi:hypothetical protein